MGGVGSGIKGHRTAKKIRGRRVGKIARMRLRIAKGITRNRANLVLHLAGRAKEKAQRYAAWLNKSRGQ
jgi:hypothetical protein